MPEHPDSLSDLPQVDTDREARLSLRLDARLKALIERAAGYSGETVTSYVIATLLRDARLVVREHEIVVLSDRDRDRFLALLDEPPVPSAALKRAARRHRDLISRDEASAPPAERE